MDIFEGLLKNSMYFYGADGFTNNEYTFIWFMKQPDFEKHTLLFGSIFSRVNPSFLFYFTVVWHLTEDALMYGGSLRCSSGVSSPKVPSSLTT